MIRTCFDTLCTHPGSFAPEAFGSPPFTVYTTVCVPTPKVAGLNTVAAAPFTVNDWPVMFASPGSPVTIRISGEDPGLFPFFRALAMAIGRLLLTSIGDGQPLAMGPLPGVEANGTRRIDSQDAAAIANEIALGGVPVIGVPKTIDNDLEHTDQTTGFDSAVAFATVCLSS